MAAVPSIFAFFFVSHLLLLHSAGEDNTYKHCPEYFHCGHLEPIRFPYTNTSYPNCGLCTVDCSESKPRLNFGMDDPFWFEVHGIGKFLDHDVLNVTDILFKKTNVDTGLRSFIKSNNCDVFSYPLNWTLPTTRSVSFTVSSPNLTLFKCLPGVGGQHDRSDDFFRRYNNSYKGCPGYTVYYKYPPDDHQVLPKNGSFPMNCLHIQLPVVSPRAFGNRNASNPFSVLDSEFSLGFQVSNECLECHQDGGLCPRYNTSKFQCMKAKEGGTHLILILGIAILGGSILLLCLLILIIQLRKKRNYRSSYISSRDTFSNPSLKEDTEGGGSLYFGAPVFSYTELKEATNNFDPTKELGDGGFGTVYHGKKFISSEYQSQR